MSEQMADQTNGDLGGKSIETGPIVPNSAAGALDQAPVSMDSPKLAPEAEPAAKTPEPPKAGMPKAEAFTVDAPKTDAPRTTGNKIMIMAPSHDNAWDGDTIDHGSASSDSTQDAGLFGKRRLSALAAIVALATVAGALGGALATAGLGHVFAGGASQAAATQVHGLENSIVRIETEVVALKTNLERWAKADGTQFSRVNDRIERVEKAQIEPAAKLARMNETLEKLRVAAATPAPSRETTGSIPAAATAAAVPIPTPKPEVARLPTVEGWALREVANGVALIESRRGIFEVYAGDAVPGVGRVDAIRKQDGRWVVVTSRGLIVAR